MNLLGNATKFTDRGSITVSLLSVDGAVELSVADAGVGIPAEDLPHLRRIPSGRATGRRADGGHRTGAGHCQKDGDLLGGTLTAQSQVGVGTTFTLRIGDYGG
ncbi:MAG TPA: hypothetical protein DIC52_05760 [Candidatus Latescibacteria bacterium]|nr:hypothetical protein [Candidatus Latescibacterota bacterium]